MSAATIRLTGSEPEVVEDDGRNPSPGAGFSYAMPAPERPGSSIAPASNSTAPA